MLFGNHLNQFDVQGCDTRVRMFEFLDDPSSTGALNTLAMCFSVVVSHFRYAIRESEAEEDDDKVCEPIDQC